MQEGESEGGWEKVLKQMKEYQSETSEIGSNISAILELSYHNLPSQLKPCFLCLAFFKEDAIIRTKRLVHIWVSLGFVQASEAGEGTAEEIGMGYLDELTKRNLVIVKDMTMDDRVKYCYVHDLIRELSIKKAKEEFGFERLIIREHSLSKSPSRKPRHRVVQGYGGRSMELDLCDQNKHIRSLFLQSDGHDGDYFINRSYWKSFQLLKILDIEGRTLAKLPSTMRAMIGIRYLRLREEAGTLVVPTWLDALKKLEVLDVAGCRYATFPDVTWKMQSLRHFYVDGSCILSESTRISTWKNLEMLKYIMPCALLSETPAQGFHRRLRKLGIELNYKSNEEAKRLNRVDGRVRKWAEELYLRWGESEQDMINDVVQAVMWRFIAKIAVEAVHIKWDEERYAPSLGSSYYGLDHLTKLKLNGPMKSFPSAHRFPQNITHLTLSRSQIIDNYDMMNQLGKLPKLLFLKLDDALRRKPEPWNSKVIHLNIKVSKEGFPRMKILQLTNMSDLETIGIEMKEGGMSELQRLEIYNCRNHKLHNLREHLRSTVTIALMNVEMDKLYQRVRFNI